MQTLKEWLDCATSFCELVRTLDREGINQAAWNGHEVSNGLHWDGRTYLRAAGMSVDRFSRSAEKFVQSNPTQLLDGLKFTVEAGEPIVNGELAILRIQRLKDIPHRQSERSKFTAIGLRQQYCEPLLFGAEARIVLRTSRKLDEATVNYHLAPSIELRYEVVGQQTLKVFASVLQSLAVQPIWEAVGGFEVESTIILTRNNAQKVIEGQWTTDDDPDGARVLKFCLDACRLSEDETCDWPPYIRLSRTLNSTNLDEDLDHYFWAISAHASCIVGQSGGWTEILHGPPTSRSKSE